eukprot:gene2341-5310_t
MNRFQLNFRIAGTICVVTLIFLAHVKAHATMDLVEVDFDAKPNGQTARAVVSMAKPDDSGEVTCTFEYAVVGGTNEQWLVTISRFENTYTCTVMRPEQASYLYFITFKLNFSGVTEITSAELTDNNGPTSTNAVSIQGLSVLPGESFANALFRLVVVGVQ